MDSHHFFPKSDGFKNVFMAERDSKNYTKIKISSTVDIIIAKI